jgi:hypothetical protein
VSATRSVDLRMAYVHNHSAQVIMAAYFNEQPSNLTPPKNQFCLLVVVRSAYNFQLYPQTRCNCTTSKTIS